ncbi:hypothetical protein EF808_01400 [archaeon]|nr:MAG: hypothetical protein EF808_01400 [archaeon]
MKGKSLLQWLKDHDILLILIIYGFGVFIRLAPKLEMDSHLPVFLGDVWYRICMSQHILDYHSLPIPDIRYIPYGDVPLWYPPLSMVGFAGLSVISGMDLPTVMTRIVPFIEAFTPIPFYFLVREWYDKMVARIALIILAITPSFILYSAIADPQVITLMVIPVVLVYLSRQRYGFSRNAALGIGVLLGINFLTHLSFFITVGLMLLYLIALKLDRRPVRNEIKFTAIALVVSLIISSWWWLPDFLFYWWIFIITTSTLLQTFGSHLTAYGAPFMILGFIGFGYLLVDRLSYVNRDTTSNPWHIAVLTIILSALCGIFAGKTVTTPVVSMLAAIAAFLFVTAFKTSRAFALIVAMIDALLIGAIATFFTHNAGNIGAWTKTFIFYQSSFSPSYLAIVSLVVVLFVFLAIPIISAPLARRWHGAPPLLTFASFVLLVVATSLIATNTSAAIGLRDIAERFLTTRALLGVLAIIFIPLLFSYQTDKKSTSFILNNAFETFLILWTIFMLYEVFSENILSIVREYGLMWETTVRPLEGYRFYIFLAQPFALLSSLFIMELRKHKRAFAYGFMIFLACIGYFTLTGFSVPDYDMDTKITNSGVLIEDYDAAVWFKANSERDDLIVADYYTGQMISGVCAGRSLIGGLFPLRNIDFNDYIKAPAQVQDDIYDFYKTSDPGLTKTIGERYGITHVYISDNMATRGWLGAYRGGGFGVPVNWNKFFNNDAFTVIYEDTSNPRNKVYILEIDYGALTG